MSSPHLLCLTPCHAAFGSRSLTARAGAAATRALAGLLLMLGLCSPAFSQQIPCPVTSPLDVFGTSFNKLSGCLVQSGSTGIFIANRGTFVNETGASLTNDDTIETAGTLENDAGAALTNFGTLSTDNGSTTNNFGTLTNAGTLHNQSGASLSSSGALLNFDTLLNGGGLLNTGTFTNFGSGGITNSGTLDNGFGATLTNMGGITNTSTLLNEGAFTSSGTVLNKSGSFKNSGTFVNDAGGGLANSALLVNVSGATLTSMGAITNTSTLLNEGAFTSSGKLTSSGLLSNSGTLTNDVGGTLLNNGTSSEILNLGALINNGTLANDGGILTNNGSATNNGRLVNDGFGEVDNVGNFTNAGTFNNTTFAVLRNVGTFTNTGTLNNGGTFTNATSVINAGTLDIQVGGVLNNLPGSTYMQTAGQTIADGTLISPSAVLLQGGTLSGNGAINGSVDNTGGIVHPGDAPGTLTIVGNYVQGPGGTLDIELGGTSPGEFSVLDVSGNAALDGTVDFTAVNGFTPTTGDDFTFLLFGTDSGDFANLDFTNWTCPAGDTCEDVFGTNSLTLEIQGPTGGTPTPEPPSLLLLGTGLTTMLGFGANRRLRHHERA